MSPRPGRGRRRDELHGVLIIDKPADYTSAAVVAAVRRRSGASTVGHTGTLDPMATGVLPVCLGAATKLAQWLTAEDKAYEAELELGLETDTHDGHGVVVRRDPEGAARVDRATLEAALAGFVGEQDQVPPMHSAIKQGGVRLHELARAGVEVDRAPRRVRIDRLELLEADLPRVRLALVCSKGTYVRSLVRDLGQRLGCGATLTALRRTASGRFTLADAIPLDKVTSPTAVAARLVSPAAAIALPVVTIPVELEREVLDGRRLDPALAPGAGLFQMLTEGGDILAIAELRDGAIALHRVLSYGVADDKNAARAKSPGSAGA